MEHARHVFRVAFVLVVVVATFLVARTFLVPKSYGLHGAYRFDNVAEQANVRAPRHGGPESCRACHEERRGQHAAGAHARVSCEICHGPLASHVADGGKVADARLDRTAVLCLRCHRRDEARPAAFKQMTFEGTHEDAEKSGCLECHDAHSPAAE